MVAHRAHLNTCPTGVNYSDLYLTVFAFIYKCYLLSKRSNKYYISSLWLELIRDRIHSLRQCVKIQPHHMVHDHQYSQQINKYKCLCILILDSSQGPHSVLSSCSWITQSISNAANNNFQVITRPQSNLWLWQTCILILNGTYQIQFTCLE